jgi:O-acetyl-ADP-ribose deacetylase
MNSASFSTILLSGVKLELVQGDLTLERVDAIVNAANRDLIHGGGVAGAIVRRGGRVIQSESDTWVQTHGPVSQAAPAVTGAGNLACRYVIHAVGPVWGEGDEDAKLAGAVSGSLSAAGRLTLASIALPAISTGIYGFPLERAARVILVAVREWASQNPESSIRLIRLVLVDEAVLVIFRTAAQEVIR